MVIDATTSDFGAVEFTPNGDGDSPVLPDLREQIGTVTADGTYDTRRCPAAIIARDAEAIIPVRRNGRLWKEDGPVAKAHNETMRASQHFGRALWKRWSGYHARSRIESRMRCLKACGERIMAREPERQTAAIHIRIALMHRFSAHGTVEIVSDRSNQGIRGNSP